ncbi:MAG: protealysin inhibitor emfourin [Chloroflexota bacterium]
MKVLIMGLLFGLWLCAACGAPAPLSPTEDTSPARQTVAVPAQSVPATTSPVLPLPTPTTGGLVSPPATPTPATSPVEQEKQPPGRQPEALGQAVLLFRRSGGLAGISEQWLIYADGRVTVDEGREWQAGAERVEQLLKTIDTLGFFELDGTYLPLDTCCDRFTYEITVRFDGKINTVTTIDAAPNAPPALQQVISEISRFLAEAQGGG